MCFFFQAEDGIRDLTVTGVQTCALPISFSEFARGPGAARARVSGAGAAPRLGPPTEGAGLADPAWNEERHAERRRVAPRLGPPTDGAGLADVATVVVQPRREA